MTATPNLSADDLDARVVTAEALDREAFRIHGTSGLGSTYLLGSLEALVAAEVWDAAVAAARVALAADRARIEAAR